MKEQEKKYPSTTENQESACTENHFPDRSNNGCSAVRAKCRTFDRYADVR